MKNKNLLSIAVIAVLVSCAPPKSVIESRVTGTSTARLSVTSTPSPSTATLPSTPLAPASTATPAAQGLTSMPIPPTLQALVEKAKEDLAQRLSIPIAQIDLVEAAGVVWSNASLGCPQPGMMYADVLTPGYLIRLNAKGLTYEYHAGKNSDPFLCENPIPPVPGMPGDT